MDLAEAILGLIFSVALDFSIPFLAQGFDSAFAASLQETID
jgi:hypothetical protein